MKVNKKTSLYPIDSKIVRGDYIIAQGSTGNFNFLQDKSPFGRGLDVPIMFIWKVHRNHPLRLSNRDYHTRVWPVADRRMPGRVVEDKLAFDMATFVLLPFDRRDLVHVAEGVTDLLPLGKSFSPVAEQSQPADASMFYINHGNDVHSCDYLGRVSLVTPSLVGGHLWHFLVDGGRVYSHEKNFNRRYEGRIEVDPKYVKENLNLLGLLKKRFNIDFSRKT